MSFAVDIFWSSLFSCLGTPHVSVRPQFLTSSRVRVMGDALVVDITFFTTPMIDPRSPYRLSHSKDCVSIRGSSLQPSERNISARKISKGRFEIYYNRNRLTLSCVKTIG